MTAADPFRRPQAEREPALLAELSGLVEHHRSRCPGYRNVLAATGHVPGRVYDRLTDLPWLPVRLFKQYDLRSVSDDEVVTVVTSSGTTGVNSRIALDRAAAAAQQRTLIGTLEAVLGPKRLPLLVVDARSTITAPGPVPARAAGILGVMPYGREVTFALDDTGRPDLAVVRDFLARNAGRPFLVFGFTFLVWTGLYQPAVAESLDFSGGVLLHSGGWKRMAGAGVSAAEFRDRMTRIGLERVHNFYGMAEQIGTVFLEGPGTGHLHCPDFADVIVRDPSTWREVPVGRPGVVQVLSTLPRSHPGHILMTEDLGVVHGVDDGDWPGKRFSILGRVPGVEVRGCSDTLRAGS